MIGVLLLTKEYLVAQCSKALFDFSANLRDSDRVGYEIYTPAVYF